MQETCVLHALVAVYWVTFLDVTYSCYVHEQGANEYSAKTN